MRFFDGVHEMKWVCFTKSQVILESSWGVRLETIQSQSLWVSSSTAGAAAVKPSINAAPVCPAVGSTEEWSTSVRSDHQSWVMFFFTLNFYLWGITVIQKNIWTCEELSCWKSSLVLSHTCPYTHSQLHKRQSSASESPTVWLCWSSFSCIFFSFIWIIPGITWELISEDVCFFPGVHHPRAAVLWESPFIWAFSPFQYFICLGLSWSWCWLRLPRRWVWRKLLMFIWEALLMPFKIFPD